MLRLLPFHMTPKLAKRFYENLLMIFVIAMISLLVVFNAMHAGLRF
jgi:hypothetical protein